MAEQREYRDTYITRSNYIIAEVAAQPGAWDRLQTRDWLLCRWPFSTVAHNEKRVESKGSVNH